MKTKICCFAILSLLIFSCTKVDQKENLETQNKVPELKSGGDLKYDVLGRGYDITGDKNNNVSSVRLAVIDMDKFEFTQKARIISDGITTSFYESRSADDSQQYITEMSSDINYSFTALPFTGSITNSYKTYKEYSSQYSFAYIDYLVQKTHLALYADNTLLTNYLNDIFVSDLQTKTAEQIVANYGTHVLVDIITGGKLHMEYRSIIKESNKKETVKAGATSTLKDVFNLTSTLTSDNTLVTKNTDASIHFQSSGGTTSFIGSGELKAGLPPQNLGGWATSVYSGLLNSAVFISTDNNTLIPIYELVTDIAKKNALKLAVENYINNSKIKLLSPFHRYYQPTSYDHLYTTTFEVEGKNWTDEGIEGYLYTYPEPGTVRLYRYYHGSGTKDHFYTTDFNDLGNGRSGWTYESAFTYYVYKTQVAGTVPLYRYFGHSQHFYTTNYAELGQGRNGWTFEKIECYIYAK